MRTSHIRLGCAALTIAMAASTLAEPSSGRFIVGLGSSHKAQVEPEHEPLTRTRETVAIVRDLIREGRAPSR